MLLRKKGWFLCLALCALVVLATACTNGKNDPSPSPSGGLGASPSVSPAPGGTESGNPSATMVPGNPNAVTSFQPGTYSASAKGMNGDVTVEVIFTQSAMKQVQVTSHQETDGIWETPVDSIPKAIVEGQTLNVETVSGATMTSNAILKAVEDCVRQAGGDVEALKNNGANNGMNNGANNGGSGNNNGNNNGGNIVGDTINGVGDVVDDIGNGIKDAGDAINGEMPGSTPYNSSRPVTTARP